MTNLEARITELETKLAFVEAANNELSELMYARTLEHERDMRRLEARLSTMQDSIGASGEQENEAPPHY